MRRGWPFFRGAEKSFYLGPLSATCQCGFLHPTSIGLRDQDDQEMRFSFTSSFIHWLATFLIQEKSREALKLLRLGSALPVQASSDEETWPADSPSTTCDERSPNHFLTDDLNGARDQTAKDGATELETDDGHIPTASQNEYMNFQEQEGEKSGEESAHTKVAKHHPGETTPSMINGIIGTSRDTKPT